MKLNKILFYIEFSALVSLLVKKELVLMKWYFKKCLVLSNPEKRGIYDVYGQKGLDAGWEVSKHKSAVKVRMKD